MKSAYVQGERFSAENYGDLAVAVLAGGASRRFGADKALIQICPGGLTLIERVIDIGRSLCAEVFIVGHERYAHVVTDVPIVPDGHPGRGPLEGIRKALQFASAPRVLLLACDMPCLSSSLLQAMGNCNSSADVILARTDDGRWQPMPGIYRRSALPAIERALRDGPCAVSSIFADVTVHELSEPELRKIDPALNSLFSVNRPEDLDRARRCVRCN